jgi:superfamily II DNA or RNA helicase
VIALAIAAHVGLRTMIMVHKEFLADQWTEVIRRFCPGSTIGRVQGDRLELENDFIICLIQTMCAREHHVKAFESIGFLIVDEAHHICAKVFSQTMFKMCPKFTLGLSATPDRKDGLSRVLNWFLGPVFFAIQRRSNEVQVQEVHFMGPFPPVPLQPSVPTMITDLCQIPERNKVLTDEIDKLLLTNRNILVLTDRRAHCQWFIDHYGDIAGLYIGGLAREALEEAANKRLIIGTFALAQEGLDIPKLDTVIFATPKADIVQASGRILRSRGNQPLIIDVIDHWCMFNSMFCKRRRQYTDMGFDQRCLL